MVAFKEIPLFSIVGLPTPDCRTESVELKTDERNTASPRAIEKIGGQFEGILRSHTLMYDGFRRNTDYYSILSSEWMDLKLGFLAYLVARNCDKKG